jgi:hypothetical protein
MAMAEDPIEVLLQRQSLSGGNAQYLFEQMRRDEELRRENQLKLAAESEALLARLRGGK